LHSRHPFLAPTGRFAAGAGRRSPCDTVRAGSRTPVILIREIRAIRG